MNKWGMGRPKPKEKLGIKVTLTPGRSVNGEHWLATAEYNNKVFHDEGHSKEEAVKYLEIQIRKQIAFDNLKEEMVEI